MPAAPQTRTPAATLCHEPAVRRGRRRTWPMLLLAALLLPLLAGCLRVQVTMGVSSNDRVSGHIVAAAVPNDDKDKGPQLKAPDSLEGKIRIESYNEDGYVGSQVYFDDLTFGEVQELGGLSDQTQGMFNLQFTRSGDLVTLNGRVDLKSVPPQGSDVQFTVAFPARVASTNGTRVDDNTVSWKLPAGDVSTLHSEVSYADPNTRSFGGWAWIVGGVTLGVAVLVAILAYYNRNPLPGRTTRV